MFKKIGFLLPIFLMVCLYSECAAHYHQRCYDIVNAETYFKSDGSYLRIHYTYDGKLLTRRFKTSSITITTDYAIKNTCAVFDPNSIYFVTIVVPTLINQTRWEAVLDFAEKSYRISVGNSNPTESIIPHFIGKEE